jgi:hypothetical protein
MACQMDVLCSAVAATRGNVRVGTRPGWKRSRDLIEPIGDPSPRFILANAPSVDDRNAAL